MRRGYRRVTFSLKSDSKPFSWNDFNIDDIEINSFMEPPFIDNINMYSNLMI